MDNFFSICVIILCYCILNIYSFGCTNMHMYVYVCMHSHIIFKYSSVMSQCSLILLFREFDVSSVCADVPVFRDRASQVYSIVRICLVPPDLLGLANTSFSVESYIFNFLSCFMCTSTYVSFKILNTMHSLKFLKARKSHYPPIALPPLSQIVVS